MKTITRKGNVREAIEPAIHQFQNGKIVAGAKLLNEHLLTAKVKFPLLQYAAQEIYLATNEKDHLAICDEIEKLKTMGGNVLLGILLQNKLTESIDLSFSKASEYISNGGLWYVSDIIGERVFGHALLTQPEKTLPQIEKLSHHQSNLVVRSLGAGTHYAVKKGLEKQYISNAFEILLSLALSKDKEIKQGIGWAAKTIAKFHPDIIENYSIEIHDKEKAANWFRGKINIGLKRHSYVKRNQS